MCPMCRCIILAMPVKMAMVSYLRVTNSDGDVHVNLILIKSRVDPLKHVSIPRMELTAATVAMRVDAMLNAEERDGVSRRPNSVWDRQ